MPKVTLALAELDRYVGLEVAVSDWVEVTQSRIDLFAAAGGDHQWIHVDPQRAAAESPFGGTIAHGFLTLALLSQLVGDSIEISGRRMGLNYGLNRVRFTLPVRAGTRVRGRFTMAGAASIADGGVQITWQAMVESEGADKPALVAEWLVRVYP